MENKKKQEYLAMIDDNIAKYGFHVTYVMEQKDFTPFGYSTGLFKSFGIPEVFISGLPNGLTNTLICNYAERFENQKIPTLVFIEDLIDRFPVYLTKVSPLDLREEILASFRLYEDEEFECLQIIFPDLNGNFPHETGYEYDQKIFGELMGSE
ncbi:MAG: DUF4262 domain-containing protein [bacterium]|nr:DUF4262 domain-containing protein [bacterium]